MNKKKALEKADPSYENIKVVSELIDLVQTQEQLDYLCYKSPQALEEKSRYYDAEMRMADNRTARAQQESRAFLKVILEMHKETLDHIKGCC